MIFTSPAPNTCIRQCGYDRGCPALKAEYIYYMADPSSLHRPALFPFIAGTTAWVYIIHSFVYLQDPPRMDLALFTVSIQ